MKYVINNPNKKPKRWVSKKKAVIHRSILCDNRSGVKGICIGMLKQSHQIQLRLIARKKTRKYLQLMVNMLKRGYGWWASTQMARYFHCREVKKIVNPQFNSNDIRGRLTSTKNLPVNEARKLIGKRSSVAKKRRRITKRYAQR